MNEYEPNDLGTLFKPTSLRYYTGICRGGVYSTELTTEECAVILKTHDYGIWSLDEEEVVLLNGVMQKLKNAIHP